MHSVVHATQIIRVGAPRVELNARTGTRHPHVVIADVDLAANVVVFEEGGKTGTGSCLLLMRVTDMPRAST